MEDLMTINELAAILRIKPKTLRNRLARKDGSAPPAIKTSNGYNIRFDRQAVADWIAGNTVSNSRNGDDHE